MFTNLNDNSTIELDYNQEHLDDDNIYQSFFVSEKNISNDLSQSFSTTSNETQPKIFKTVKEQPAEKNLLQNKKNREKRTKKTEEDLYLKKLERMEKNRISAQKSRERVKNELHTLKEQNLNLINEIERLKKEIEEKDNIISLLKKGLYVETTNNTNITIEDEAHQSISGSSSASSPNGKNVLLFASSMLTIIVILMIFSGNLNISNNIIKKTQIRMLGSDEMINRPSPRVNLKQNFLSKTEEKDFISKALPGTCQNSQNISISVMQKKGTDLVPLEFFQEKNNQIANNVFYYPSFNLTIQAQLEQIQFFNNFIMKYLKDNSKYNIDEKAWEKIKNGKEDCIYLRVILPFKDNSYYSVDCKVLEVNKYIK